MLLKLMKWLRISARTARRHSKAPPFPILLYHERVEGDKMITRTA